MAWHDADVPTLQRRARRRRVWGRTGLYASAIAFSLFAVFPFSWALISMFKQSSDLYVKDNNPFWFNMGPTLEHLRLLFVETNYLTFIRNSFIVGLAVTLITLVLALPMAYALARLRLRWGERMGIAVFLVYLIPPTLLFIPMTRVVTYLGLQESLWSLILVYPTITIPISSWLLMGFFKGIPMDIEEQAMVDGQSRIGAISRVVLPLMVPGIIAVVVFAFTLSAHEFIYALAFNKSSAVKTIATGVPTELIRGDVFFWQSLQAAVIIVAIPIALVFNAFLDRFIKGFTMGAVKG
ncbi:MAG TPA: carbohydrate ABC transporter permease [Acidimicrobiia bacterium]|jgi:multiple sugar transport system permease protein|nr:carbohydrate ABC transporter permease [Acidimicrobiia bacterium]